MTNTTKENSIVNIHGKEYETVASRLQKFRSDHPEWSLLSEIIKADERHVIIKASILDDNNRCRSVGHSEETRNSSLINETSAMENAETSAWGRALANLGYGGTQIASADEVQGAISQQENIQNNPQQYSQPAYSQQPPNQPEEKKDYTLKNPHAAATEKQVKFMKYKLSDKGITDPNFLSNMGISSLEAVTMQDVNKVLESIENYQPQEDVDF